MALDDGRIQIRMVTGIVPYNTSETPAFRPEFSHELVVLGVAEYTDPADGPPRPPACQFAPVGELEANMLKEIERLSAPAISASDAGMMSVTWADAKYDRVTGEIRR